MYRNHGAERPTRISTRWVGYALGLVLAVAAPRAQAWEYPLLPHVHGLAFSPGTPDDSQPTQVTLSASYSGECWRLIEVQRESPERLNVLVERITACGDSGSSWFSTQDLGVLAAGMHTLTVHCTALDGLPPAIVEETTLTFEVVAAPPPPPPVERHVPIVLEYEFTPSAPRKGETVVLRVTGRAPFNCFGLHGERVLDPTHAEMTFDHIAACADTNRRWERTFALGAFAAGGDYRVELAMHVIDTPDSVGTFHAGFPLTVLDPDVPPPPPPPPGDSLRAVLSVSSPNPFRDQTQFAVSLAEPSQADVAVYDVGGRRLVTIHSGTLPRGTSQFAWDGKRRDGSRAPGGIYFYRLTMPGRVVTRRVVLLGTP